MPAVDFLRSQSDSSEVVHQTKRRAEHHATHAEDRSIFSHQTSRSVDHLDMPIPLHIEPIHDTQKSCKPLVAGTQSSLLDDDADRHAADESGDVTELADCGPEDLDQDENVARSASILDGETLQNTSSSRVLGSVGGRGIIGGCVQELGSVKNVNDIVTIGQHAQASSSLSAVSGIALQEISQQVEEKGSSARQNLDLFLQHRQEVLTDSDHGEGLVHRNDWSQRRSISDATSSGHTMQDLSASQAGPALGQNDAAHQQQSVQGLVPQKPSSLAGAAPGRIGAVQQLLFVPGLAVQGVAQGFASLSPQVTSSIQFGQHDPNFGHEQQELVQSAGAERLKATHPGLAYQELTGTAHRAIGLVESIQLPVAKQAPDLKVVSQLSAQDLTPESPALSQQGSGPSSARSSGSITLVHGERDGNSKPFEVPHTNASSPMYATFHGAEGREKSANRQQPLFWSHGDDAMESGRTKNVGVLSETQQPQTDRNDDVDDKGSSAQVRYTAERADQQPHAIGDGDRDETSSTELKCCVLETSTNSSLQNTRSAHDEPIRPFAPPILQGHARVQTIFSSLRTHPPPPKLLIQVIPDAVPTTSTPVQVHHQGGGSVDPTYKHSEEKR